MRVRIIDAFTERAFGGNPAGVCLFDGPDWPADAWLADVATELDLPMTAFAVRASDNPDADWDLRWFNAHGEERFCGHATLAIAHALAEDRGAGGRERFATLSGVLGTEVADDGMITMDFPAATVAEAPAPEGLAEALGAVPEATLRTGALRDLLAVFADEAAVRALAPDMDALAALNRREDIRGVTATAPGPEFDVVSRFFSPNDGLPEDHVTGSAHTALAPYWSARLGLQRLRAFQASRRGGALELELRGDRVLISGRAVTVLDGSLRC